MHHRKEWPVLALALALLLPAAAWSAASAWKPGKHLELIVAAAAGSGVGSTARTIQRILQSEGLEAVRIAIGDGTLAMNPAPIRSSGIVVS